MRTGKRYGLVYINQKTISECRGFSHKAASICRVISRRTAGVWLTAILFIMGLNALGNVFSLPDMGPYMIEAKAADAPTEGKRISDLNLENGIYIMDVTCEGGLVGTQISSPQRVQIKDGTMTALVEWESEYYQYMDVNGTRYFPEDRKGNSKFKIPVSVTDADMPVTVCRNDLGVAGEAQCILRYDSSTIKRSSTRTGNNTAIAMAGFSFLGIMVLTSVIMIFLHHWMKRYSGGV